MIYRPITTTGEEYSQYIKLSNRIEDAVKYLQAQKDIDPESGRIFMPVQTARRIIHVQAEKRPGCMVIWDPSDCDSDRVCWFGCRVVFCWEAPRKLTVEFVQKCEARITRQNNGVWVKILDFSQRICMDIPIPEELQKCPE